MVTVYRPTYTQKEFKQVEPLIKNILKRNEITKLDQIRDKLKKAGVDTKLIWNKNLSTILDEMNVSKVNGVYSILNAINSEIITQECMRCENELPYSLFKNVNNYGRQRLKICMRCINEESDITGESITELVGIYEYLQHRYRKVLDKSMYSRFWEQAIYGRSSSVSSQSM